MEVNEEMLILTNITKLNVAVRDLGDKKLIYPWSLRDASHHRKNYAIPVSITVYGTDMISDPYLML